MKCKPFICLLLLVSNIFILTFVVNSNAAAPIPQLKIKVRNPPSEPYYLDLLKNSPSGKSNINDIERYDPEMLDLLHSYEDEGWFPAYSGGTNAPLWGDLVGVKEIDRITHTFEYFGLPLIYRVIIVTQSGDVQVSRIMTRTAVSMQSSVTYDYKDNTFLNTPTWFAYLIRFIVICLPALLIELIVLKIFKFRIRHNWKPFLFMNLFTQFLLILTLGVTVNTVDRLVNAYFILIPTILSIFSIEILIGVKFLRGRSPKMKVIYVFCANLMSFMAEILWFIPFALRIITEM
jgi:hypothetical protein